MESQKSWLRRRSTRYGTNVGLMILIVLGIVVVIEAFSMNHHWRLDLTKNRRYTLAPQTLKVLDALKAPVKAYAFYQEADPTRAAAEDLLRLYEYQSGKKLTWEFVDPDRFPLRAQNFKVTSYNTIVLEQGEVFEKVPTAEEERVTNALIKLTHQEKRMVYCLQGHGERGLDSVQKEGFSEAKKALENENYEVKPLLLAREEGVPADATAVVVAGPQKALQPSEEDALRAFLARGGRLLILVDPQAAPGMDPFLKPYGIELDEDVIVDRASPLIGGDYLVPIIAEYETHPITRDFRDRPVFAYLPLARSVRSTEKPPDGVKVETLARTGAGSWGEKDWERLKKGEAELNPDDIQGPLSVAVAATIQAKDGGKEGRMVVFGDSDFASNGAIDPNRSVNQDLFLNAVNWLSELEEQISIRAKSAPSRPVMLRPGQWTLVFVLVVVAFSLAILGVGIGVWWRRRNRK